MIHYIYKIIFLKGNPKGKYYIGKRSTDKYDNCDEDPYTGSGVFCKAYFKKYGAIKNVTYKKICLEENDSFKENSKREKYWIGDLWELDPLCMNKIPGGGGAQNIDDITIREIYQYDVYGNFINKYNNESEASRKTGIANGVISKCCRRKTTNGGGYIWRFKGDVVTKKDIDKAIYECGLIDQYTEDGKFIKTWIGTKEAAQATGSNPSGIYNCINHSKNRHTCNGYIWVKHGEIPTNSKRIPFKGKRKVGKYDNNGNVLNIYNSLAEAASSEKTFFQNIQLCCSKNSGANKNYKSHGFIWRYID